MIGAPFLQVPRTFECLMMLSYFLGGIAVVSCNARASETEKSVGACIVSTPVTQRAPTPRDDTQRGYAAGDLWNWPGHGLWRCTDPSPDAARWVRLPTGILPLDAVPGLPLHGYGTRRLRKEYNGPLLTVKSVVGKAIEIGARADGNVDIGALAEIQQAQVIERGVAPRAWSIEVTKWYDQGEQKTVNNLIVPNGSYSPQISTQYMTAGSPHIAFASGSVNYLTASTPQMPRLYASGLNANTTDASVVVLMRSAYNGVNAAAVSFSDTAGYPLFLASSYLASGHSDAKKQVYGSIAVGLAGIGAETYQTPLFAPLTPAVIAMTASGSNLSVSVNEQNWHWATDHALKLSNVSYSAGQAYATLSGVKGLTTGMAVKGKGLPAHVIIAALQASPPMIQFNQNASEALSQGEISVIPFAEHKTSGGLVLNGVDSHGSAGQGGETFSAVIVGPALTTAQQAAVYAALVETFGLTPQVRDRLLIVGASTEAGVGGWADANPGLVATEEMKWPVVAYNQAIGGQQLEALDDSSVLSLFSHMEAPLYSPYGLNLLYLGEGAAGNSLLAGQQPDAVLASYQHWVAKGRHLGGNIMLGTETLVPGVKNSSIRKSYNTGLRSLRPSYDGLLDLADDPILGSDNILSDRTLTAPDTIHHTTYYQSVEGKLMASVFDAMFSDATIQQHPGCP